LFTKKSKDKIKKQVKNSKTCFFCANEKKPGRFVSIPMPVQDREQNKFWFLLPAGSFKKSQLNADIVQLLFQGKTFSDFLLLEGTCAISNDREKIKDLWKSVNKEKFAMVGNASRIMLIKFKPAEGYCWNTKLKMVEALPTIKYSKADKPRELKAKMG
jgi:general stress protein 26